MRKVFLILILGLLNFQTNVFSSDKIINQLKNGGNIIFIRHAIAPGNGDPDNFDLRDCSTQRNLASPIAEAASVLIGPALIAFTLIFLLPRSRARYFTLASKADLQTPITL